MNQFHRGWRYFWAVTERPAPFILGFLSAVVLMNFVAWAAGRALRAMW